MIREGENRRVTVECLGAFFLNGLSASHYSRNLGGKPHWTLNKSGRGKRPYRGRHHPEPEARPCRFHALRIGLNCLSGALRAWNLRGRAQGLVGFVLCFRACPLPDLFFLTSAEKFFSHRLIILGAREPEPLHIPVQVPNRLVEQPMLRATARLLQLEQLMWLQQTPLPAHVLPKHSLLMKERCGPGAHVRDESLETPAC